MKSSECPRGPRPHPPSSQTCVVTQPRARQRSVTVANVSWRRRKCTDSSTLVEQGIPGGDKPTNVPRTLLTAGSCDVLHSSSIPLLFSTFIPCLQCAWQNGRGDTWSLTAPEETQGAWEENTEMWVLLSTAHGSQPQELPVVSAEKEDTFHSKIHT